MKKLLAWMLAVSAALCLSACGGAPGETTVPHTKPVIPELTDTGLPPRETAGTGAAATEPGGTGTVGTEPETAAADDAALPASFAGLWSREGADSFLNLCEDWTWERLDPRGYRLDGGGCRFLEGRVLILERDDGTEEDRLWLGEDGNLCSVASALLRADGLPETGPTGENLTSYPCEGPETADVSDLVREIYSEIYPKVVGLEDFSRGAPTYDGDYLDALIEAEGLILDYHPETRIYFHLEEDLDEDGNRVLRSRYAFRGSEDKEEIRAALAEAEAYADSVTARLTEDMTAYEKYFLLASAISENAEYDEGESEELSSPWGALMGGRCGSEGYAAAMRYLCGKADLYCGIVRGGSGEQTHCWNLVMTPGGTYHVDVALADRDGEPEDFAWQKHFMLTQDEILNYHDIYDGTVATGQ